MLFCYIYIQIFFKTKFLKVNKYISHLRYPYLKQLRLRLLVITNLLHAPPVSIPLTLHILSQTPNSNHVKHVSEKQD